MMSWRLSGLVLGLALAAGTAQAADPASCQKVRFSDVGWTDITATTALASAILEGLGYEPTAEVLSVPVTYRLAEEQGHRRLPRQLDADHGGRRQALSRRQVGRERRAPTSRARNTPWRCRDYVYDGGRQGLRRHRQVQADKFDGKIYGIEPGNDGNRLIHRA